MLKPIGVLLIELSMNVTEPTDCEDILIAALQLLIMIDLKVHPQSKAMLMAVTMLLNVILRIVNC